MTYQLNDDQNRALSAIRDFLTRQDTDVFILRGSAGTGKTTLLASLHRALETMHMTAAFLAPTGRAARILGGKLRKITGDDFVEARTIHSAIYVLSDVKVNEEAESATDPGLRMIFPLKEEEPGVSLIVVDEASLVGDRDTRGDVVQFGSGRLLHDLVSYARAQRKGYANPPRTRLLFVGDPAQLPPVGESESPALSAEYLTREFHLTCESISVEEVVRQAKGSAILARATVLRDAIAAGNFNAFSIAPDPDSILHVDAASATDRIVHELGDTGSSIVVVRSNALALEYNRSIRGRLWGDETLPIQVGDTLLVNKNSSTFPVSNGDLLRVVSAPDSREVCPVGLRGGHVVELVFRQLVVAQSGTPAGDGGFPITVLENLLESTERELSALETRALLVDFSKRHPDLKPRTAEFRALLRQDPYFNAVQIKYGYALTCHKAQGGEWPTVVIDFSGEAVKRNADSFRWAYTAITRASQRLELVNPPRFSEYDCIFKGRPTEMPPGSKYDNPGQNISPFEGDPDWSRFAFTPAISALFEHHLALRQRWQDIGIHIDSLQHLQYLERYRVSRDGQVATVQYHHDKHFRMTRTSFVQADSAFTREALAAMTAPIPVAPDGGAVEVVPSDTGNQDSTSEDFITRFLEEIDRALEASSIRRVDARPMSYRLRVKFTDANRAGELDFIHDRTGRWTSSSEVGGAGKSRGLLEEVKDHLKRGLGG